MEAEQLQNKQIKWEQNPIKDIYLVKKSNKLLTYKKKKKKPVKYICTVSQMTHSIFFKDYLF